MSIESDLRSKRQWFFEKNIIMWPGQAMGLEIKEILLQEINQQGTTLLMVTHDNELAQRAHRNIQILDGQLTDINKSQLTDLAV